MIPPFDIFQTATDGTVRWLEAAATLQDATVRVQILARPQPSEYLIFNQKTGRKFVIKLDGMDALSQLDPPWAIASQSVAQENQNGQ
jgi:hypothetical protein